MEELFEEECEKFIQLIESQDVSKLIKQAERLDLFKEINNDKFKMSLKNKIFNFYKKCHDKLMEQQKREIKTVEIDVNLDSLMSLAERLGKVKAKPLGYENCEGYKPPYPTREMMTWDRKK